MGERRGAAREPATEFANLRKKMEKNRLKGNKLKQNPGRADR